jgi:hypothetical protein
LEEIIMSLKEEQILRGCQIVERQQRIYSTGVYLVPMKIQIRGINQFVWVADAFNDDTFDSEGECVTVNTVGDTIDDLYD